MRESETQDERVAGASVVPVAMDPARAIEAEEANVEAVGGVLEAERALVLVDSGGECGGHHLCQLTFVKAAGLHHHRDTTSMPVRPGAAHRITGLCII